MARGKSGLFSERIYHDLGKRLAKAEFAEGDLLPSERELSASYQASRPTIRRALARLSLEGLLESQPGIGYRVKSHKAIPPTAAGSRLIGLVVDSSGSLHSKGIRVLERLLTAQGFSLLLGFSDLMVENENECLQRFLGVGAAGFVIIPAIQGTRHPQLGDLIQRGFPIVALGEPRAWCVGPRLSAMVSVVDVDNTTAMNLNLSHLYELGHRRIGLVLEEAMRGITTIRQRAYTAFLQEQQLESAPEWLVYADTNDPHAGEEPLLHLLADRASAPTAFVCQTNALARHTAGLLRNAGIRIPEELSLTGFGVIEAQDRFLTCVNYSAETYAREVVRALVAQLDGNAVRQKTLLLPVLEPGHSACAPRTALTGRKSPAAPPRDRRP
jgi:GntR family transcriptional regulator of arabinose operon